MAHGAGSTKKSMTLSFEIVDGSKETSARLGKIHTPHGCVDTPAFMPVGTQATVKSLTPEDLLALGVQIILANTYHLYLRPGHHVISTLGGLHRFMHWEGPILTDSGGYQVFSLAKLRKISEQGVTFQSHLDGSTHLLTPEKAVEIQEALGADIMMCLDECTPYPATQTEARRSLTLSIDWARRCKETSRTDCAPLFGIVQGGMFQDLRAEGVKALTDIGFDGYALGGLSVGEPKEAMMDVAAFTLPLLPEALPRYVMGVGAPADLVEMVSLGADIFDCVIPTRHARNGQLFLRTGTLNICNAQYQTDERPVEAGCPCYTCTHYSRAYLRHLFMARELLVHRLTTIHNIHYFMALMSEMRAAIRKGRFALFKRDFYAQRDL
jgi:queuine tRNA-ribosyltransferase